MSNMTRRTLLGLGAAGIGAAFLGGRWTPAAAQARGQFAVTLTEAQWRARLSADAFAILRRSGTERPGSSPLNNEHRHGIFHCAGCNQSLFSATTKFDSGTGWPSFYQPLPRATGTTVDRSLGGARTEVHCARCGGHLGHVFNDGPRPTGLRYCMNGAAMHFTPA